jgi:hypothetical protein
MHQIASDLNKARREPFFDVVVSDWVTEIVQQVTTYRNRFSGGYRHLIRGRIIMPRANHTMAGLQSGSFMATRFQNGGCPKCRVHFYGSMGNVC